MTLAFIGIGSNQGDRLTHIQAAISYIRKIPESTGIAVSPFYESAAITHGDPQPDFINGVVAIETNLSATDLLHHLHDIEAKMGRPLPRAKWQQRSIDLDLLSYGNKVLEDSELILPHPEMSKRLFVLLPLRDIAPAWVHPQTQETIDALITACCARGDQRIVQLPC